MSGEAVPVGLTAGVCTLVETSFKRSLGIRIMIKGFEFEIEEFRPVCW